ncbi:MAG: site-specific DNA-methyltransferase [Spirochaetales bacterium]|nr:site-specific DNA-methyltransferase [Spirochaetales bacterium]
MIQGTLLNIISGNSEYNSIISNSAIICGSAIDILKALPDNYFQSCITSPPYWGLRDYGVSDQIGAEDILNDYIRNLTAVFQQVKRVLKEDGTFWLNVGDSYTSGNRTWRDIDKKNQARAMKYRPQTPSGLKPKDLIGVPWRIAFALQNDGWYLRSDIIWHKPNCQPESVQDRPTRCHEYIFLLSKNEKYFYNPDAIKEESTNGLKKNKRSVWSINTEPFTGAHFATFPEALVSPCILAGSKEKDIILDPFFGSGTVGYVSLKFKRSFVGIDINPEYIKIAKNRIGLDNTIVRKMA